MSRPLDPNTVVKAVATWYRVKPVSIMGSSRNPRITRARHVSMYLMRKDGLSLTEVGNVFKRNHASVIYARTRIEQLLSKDNEFEKDLRKINYHVKEAHNQTV